jgi:hypothetical protein
MSKSLLPWTPQHWLTEHRLCFATYLSMYDNAAGPEIPVAQQQRILLAMFPEPWVRNFTNSGQNPSTLTIATLLAYMNEQHSAEVSNNERKCGFDNGSGQNGHTKRIRIGGNNHHYQQRGGRWHNNNYNNNNGRNHFHRGGNGGGRGNGNSHGSLPPIQPDDECCIHGGHKWWKCYLNPWRDNDAPFYGGRGGGHGDHRTAGQQHHYAITNGEDHSSHARVQRTSFMAEHLEGMLVCMLVMKVHNPTRLADLFRVD